MPTTAFLVYGKPVTQGSMTAVYNRKTGRASVRHVQSLPLMKWRRSIKEAAQAAGARPTGLPVSVSIVFGMPRPKAHYRSGQIIPKHRSELPAFRDLDKLIRAVLDALSGVCFDDDRQVVELHAVRVYASFTAIEVNHIAYTDAARLAAHAEENSNTGQIPLSVLWEAGE